MRKPNSSEVRTLVVFLLVLSMGVAFGSLLSDDYHEGYQRFERKIAQLGPVNGEVITLDYSLYGDDSSPSIFWVQFDWRYSLTLRFHSLIIDLPSGEELIPYFNTTQSPQTFHLKILKPTDFIMAFWWTDPTYPPESDVSVDFHIIIAQWARIQQEVELPDVAGELTIVEVGR